MHLFKKAVIFLLCLAGLLSINSCKEPGEGRLMIFSGDTMRPIIEGLAEIYGKDKVLVNYGESSTSLDQIVESRKGDIYVCHWPFGHVAREKGIGDEALEIGYMFPAIAVKKGNPFKIKDISDLSKTKAKLGLPDPNNSTAGRILYAFLDKGGVTKDVKPAFQIHSSGQLVSNLRSGALDAVVAWDTVIKQFDDIELIPLFGNDEKVKLKFKVDSITSATKKTYPVDKKVAIVLLKIKYSKNKAAVSRFFDVAKSDEGKKIVEKSFFSLEPDF